MGQGRRAGGQAGREANGRLSPIGTSEATRQSGSNPTAQSNSQLRAENPKQAHEFRLGRWAILKSCSWRANLAAPFEDTLIDNPSRHTPPEPTGKMKYIHSEETLEIPEGGTVDPLRCLNPPAPNASQAEPSIARKEEDKTTRHGNGGSRPTETDMQVLMPCESTERQPPRPYFLANRRPHRDATSWGSVSGD